VNVNDFISEYPFIYKNCIDSQTRRIINDKLNKVIAYFQKKYVLFNRQQFFLYLVECSEDYQEIINGTVDFFETTFINSDDLNFFDNTFISSPLQSSQLTTINDKREFLNDRLWCKDEQIKEIDEEISELTKQLRRQGRKLTLKPELNKDQLNLLSTFLCNNNLIDNKFQRDIENIFLPELVRPLEPITWKNSNRLIAYFFESFFDNLFIKNRNYASVIETCELFYNESGKLLNANDIAVAKNEYNNYGNPLGHKIIDSLIFSLRQIKH
jgi:hypothetical protein